MALHSQVQACQIGAKEPASKYSGTWFVIVPEVHWEWQYSVITASSYYVSEFTKEPPLRDSTQLHEKVCCNYNLVRELIVPAAKGIPQKN